MQKFFPIAILLVGLSETGFSQHFPDTSISRQIQLNQLIVTAERNPIQLEQLKRSVQVFTKQDIEKLPVSTLTDLLAYALNTDVRNRGTYGMQADISVRGGTFEQTLVLLNGINISDPQTGHHTMDIPIDLESVSRIEVLKGASARVFGPNAFNGVVNIITIENTSNSLSFKAIAGQYGYYSLYGNLNYSVKNWSQSIQLGTTGSDGFTNNTDFKSSNLYYTLGFGKRKQFEFQASYLKKDFGANSFYTPRFPDQYEETRTFFSSMKYKTKILGLAPTVYFRRHYDRFQLFRYLAPPWYKSHNYHFTDVIGSNANVPLISKAKHSTTVGYDLRFELIKSNKLGDSLESTIPVPGENDIFYNLGKERASIGMYFQENVNLKNISISAGLLVNYLSAYSDKLAFYPGIDLSYQIATNLRWYASANRTMRLPTFTELYYNDASSKGDPTLKPETAYAAETGFKYNIKGLNIDLAAFKRWGTNMIDWVKLNSESPWLASNITRVNVAGFETQIKINFHDLFGITSFLKNASLSYSYLLADKQSDDYMSRYVLDILKHKVDITLNHRIYNKLGCSWALNFQDREGGYIKYTNLVPDKNETQYKPTFQLDLQLNYTYSNFVFFAEASNIFDTEIIDFGNVPQPGRWLRIGTRFKAHLPEKLKQ